MYSNCVACSGLRESKKMTNGLCPSCVNDILRISESKHTDKITVSAIERHKNSEMKRARNPEIGDLVQHEKYGHGRVVGKWFDKDIGESANDIVDVLFGKSRILHSVFKKRLKIIAQNQNMLCSH